MTQSDPVQLPVIPSLVYGPLRILDDALHTNSRKAPGIFRSVEKVLDLRKSREDEQM